MTATTPLLEIRDLRKSFASPDQGRVDVIAVPAFVLDASTQVAIRGESGTGKTTFLHLIAGIITPDSGSVRVSGNELVGMAEGRRDAWRARTLGYVHQSFNLLQGLSALENVRVAMSLGRGDDAAVASQLLERVGLGARMNYRPSQLSAGQQQRVAVARALANRPALVLADEPTAALDVRHRDEIIALLRDTCRESGAALLLVSHDEAVLRGFETVVDFRDINAVDGAVPT
jgi:putative ABC transport system ATP-binding protein